MSGYIGMLNVEEVESLGNQLSHQADSLTQLQSKLQNLVSTMASNWDGADSLRFHDAWTNTYSTQINHAIGSLQSLSHAAIRNAQEQRDTSR